MAENDLNTYFKHSTPGGFENIAEFESGTRTYKSNYTGLHSELKRGTRSFVSFMRFRATFNYLLQFLLTTRVKQIPSLSFKHTVFHKQECNTTNNRFFLYLLSFFRIKSEKYPFVSGLIFRLIFKCPHSSTICNKTSLI